MGLIADQTVHALLAAQHPVGVVPAHREDGAVDADRLARLQVVDRHLPALALAVARVHAEEHIGPVLRLESALTGVDGDDRVAGVEFVVEPRGELEGVRALVQRGDGRRDLGVEVAIVLLERELVCHLGVFERRKRRVVFGYLVAQRRRLAHGRLRFFLVVPKTGGRGLQLEVGKLRSLAFDVQVGAHRLDAFAQLCKLLLVINSHHSPSV